MSSASHDATPSNAAPDAAPRIATTVRLDPELHRRLRIHVAEKSTTVQDWIEAQIVDGLRTEGAF